MTANDPRYEGVVGRARFLQDRCRDILLSNDPVSRILRDESKCAPGNAEVQSNLELIGESKVKNLDPKAVADEVPNEVKVLDSVGKDNCNPPSVGGDWWQGTIGGGGCNYPPPGKKFYLNRLEFMDHNSSVCHLSISLLELIHPVESVSRMFIATFTSDIKWRDCPKFSMYCFPSTVLFLQTMLYLYLCLYVLQS